MEQSSRSHYDNLQISENASIEVIKGAYKHLIQKYHPDKSHIDPAEASRITLLLTKAYETLSNPVKRKEHDEWLRSKRSNDSSQSSTDNVVGFDIDAAYELLAKELKGKNRKEGQWLKSLDQARFDETKALGIYIQLRMEQEKQEFVALKQAAATERARHDATIAEAEAELRKEKAELRKKAERLARVKEKYPEVVKKLFVICPGCECAYNMEYSTCECGRTLSDQPLNHPESWNESWYESISLAYFLAIMTSLIILLIFVSLYN